MTAPHSVPATGSADHHDDRTGLLTKIAELNGEQATALAGGLHYRVSGSRTSDGLPAAGRAGARETHAPADSGPGTLVTKSPMEAR